MTKRSVLPESGRKEIFLNIGEIYALNFDLLQELEERIEHWYVNTNIVSHTNTHDSIAMFVELTLIGTPTLSLQMSLQNVLHSSR